jgi:hypothetical protein
VRLNMTRPFSKSSQMYHPSTALLIDAKQSLILTAKLNNNQKENIGNVLAKLGWKEITTHRTPNLKIVL